MTYELGENRYGKSRIRLVVVRRGEDRHDLRDLTIDVALEGDFDAAHIASDNTNVVATDTMKNTVYAFAQDHLTGSPEAFGIELARHFAASPQVAQATITLREHAWARIDIDGREAPDAFLRSSLATRTATVRATSGDVTVESGIEDLTVLKTTKSAFVGFERDRYTTLADAADRIMATRISASWGYGAAAEGADFDFDAAHARLLDRLLASLAVHVSPSVQTSIWIMATAMLDAVPTIEWVRMVLPNLHHWSVDLRPFGMENRGEVFVATTEPHGLIDATVRRGQGRDGRGLE
jgi:urate oxidase